MVGLILLLQALTIAVSGPPASLEYLPIRVAAAEGYFDREGLAVAVRTTRAEVGAAEALAQGQVDLAATSVEAVLRFGYRVVDRAPRLVFGLTAAPPVALLAPTTGGVPVRKVADLEGLRVGLVAPGAPEHTWFGALLAKAGLKMTQVEVLSAGTRGLVGAIETGEMQAAMVEEPAASRLLAEGRASMVADLRTPDAVRVALGGITVNAAIFARSDRRPADRDLTALARALLAAERQIASASPDALASRLNRTIVGIPEEFDAKLQTVRGLYLADGAVTTDQLRDTISMIRAHLPLPAILRVPRAEDMLYLAPVKRAVPARK
jgi:NitT/TauT family transport system substrate-binding protein